MDVQPSDRIERPQRPALATVLICLHSLGILGTVARGVLSPGSQDLLLRTGASRSWVVVSSSLLALYLLGTVVGLWLGKPWGWWLTAGFYLYAAASAAVRLAILPGIAPNQEFLALHAVKAFLRGSVCVTILILLFSARRMEYFRLTPRPLRQLGWLTLAVLAVVSIQTVLAYALPS